MAKKVDTERTLTDIEVALARTDEFNFVRNIVAFNVHDASDALPIWHEVDMLVMTKSGYLTEIEIKRSWSDFLADFNRGSMSELYHHIRRNLANDVSWPAFPKDLRRRWYLLSVISDRTPQVVS